MKPLNQLKKLVRLPQLSNPNSPRENNQSHVLVDTMVTKVQSHVLQPRWNRYLPIGRVKVPALGGIFRYKK